MIFTWIDLKPSILYFFYCFITQLSNKSVSIFFNYLFFFFFNNFAKKNINLSKLLSLEIQRYVNVHKHQNCIFNVTMILSNIKIFFERYVIYNVEISEFLIFFSSSISTKM